MYKGVAAIGDRDSMYGFSAMGLSTFFVKNEAEARNGFRSLCRGDYAIIYVTEAVAETISDEIEKTKDMVYPAVIVIPGIFGNTGKGRFDVHRMVEKAVGSDILSGK